MAALTRLPLNEVPRVNAKEVFCCKEVALSTRQIEQSSGKDAEVFRTRLESCLIIYVKNEMTCIGSLILRDQRIVVPEILRRHIIEVAHESQGILKRKQRL